MNNSNIVASWTRVSFIKIQARVATIHLMGDASESMTICTMDGSYYETQQALTILTRITAVMHEYKSPKGW